MSKKAYNKQWNNCVNIFRNEKRKYYEELNNQCITNNKKFWGTIKPFFSGKRLASKITLAESLNNHFGNTINGFEINHNLFLNSTNDIYNPIQIATRKYENHPGILKIKETLILEYLIFLIKLEKDK